MYNKDLIKDENIKWVEGTGPHANIVVSSRIRLARNLGGEHFPHRLDTEAQKAMVEKLAASLKLQTVEKLVGALETIPLNVLPPLDKQILIEKHLISPQHAEPGGYKAVALNKDGTISIMINEEDHLRIQVLLSGLQLQEALRVSDAIDDVIEGEVDYAFDESSGYLTSCPTNVGTGLRASVMMHLPGLVLTRQASRVLSALSQVGLTVRGLYGEGTEAAGNLFQVSNQITLGPGEEEIINNLSSIAKQLLDQELEAREGLRKQTGLKFKDRLWRALGILKHARLIDTEEALRLMSEVRLGVEMDLIEGIDPKIFNSLLVQIQPGFLQLKAGKELKPTERDAIRAEIIRNKL